MSQPEKIAIKVHPRAFAAFGADLVTNDMVALTELVKNCYDAFALEVKVSFRLDDDGEPCIDISDDGCGMTREVIDSAWATIATPYKQDKPEIRRVIKDIEHVRIVSGNKGLGRFSAARLGSVMIMQTKSQNEICWYAEFDWKALSSETSFDECFMSIREMHDNPFANNENQTGTIIRIKGLKAIWDDDKIEQLREELARLLSPFNTSENFSIKISCAEKPAPIIIKPTEFIHHPKYKIEGKINISGEIRWEYHYNDLYSVRKSSGIIKWEAQSLNEQISLFAGYNGDYCCGPFSFEIRAWDLDKNSVDEVSSSFNITKTDVRRAIRKYKGISVYRDNVLVLPKSDTSRDWLGLDAKRISDIGRRISTSQIVGIVYITSKDNPGIKDTTDREKIVDTIEYGQFMQILKDVIDKLQSERMKDHTDENNTTFSDLISPLSSKGLLAKATNAAAKGLGVNTIINYIEEYNEKNESNLSELNKRLIYYAQTASLGSVAIVILHEFLTGMNAIKRFLHRCRDYAGSFDGRTQVYFEDACNGHKRITEVASSFAPLYRKNLKNEKHTCNLLEMIQLSIRLIQSKKSSKGVTFEIAVDDNIIVDMYGGELQTVFINLLDNACFWLNETNQNNKIIEISATPLESKRHKITVSDNGPGVPEDEADKIFYPGITSKLRGIGMGLVIVSEILSYYNGKIATSVPGNLDGATFFFDIPTRRSVNETFTN